MAKNMTRKGLALGSIAALVIGSFVGAAPAQAADGVSLDAAFGTKGAAQNGILGYTFDLVLTSTNEANTRLYITGVSAASLDVARFDAATLTADANTGTPTTLTVANNLAALNAADAAGKLDNPDADADTSDVVVNPWITSGNLGQLRVGLNGITSTTTITITPFHDTNPRDGLPSTFDFKGTPITLTFHKQSEVTGTTTLLTPAIGGASVSAEVTLDKSINSGAVAGSPVKVEFKQNGTRIGNVIDAAWNKTDSIWEADSDAISPVIASTDIISAQAFIGSTATGGNVSFGSAQAGTADSIGDNLFTSSANVRTVSNNAQLKAGAGTVEVSAKVTPAGTAAKSGQKVTFTFTRSSLRAAASITVDGKTLARTGASSIKVDALTDSDGVAKVNVSYTGFATTTTADAVLVQASALGTAEVKRNTQRSMTAVDVAATSLVEANTIGTGAYRAIAKNGSVTVDLQLVDQFGQPVASERRMVMRMTAVGGGSFASNVEASVVGTAVTSSGSATVSVVDASTASTGTYELRVAVQKKDANGNWTADLPEAAIVQFSMGGAAVTSVTTTSAIAADSTEATYKDLQTVAVVANDGRKLALSAAPYDNTSTTAEYFTLTGSARSSSGAGVAGVPVTIAAAGIGFATAVNAADAVFTKDSITVYTNSTGQYTVYAFSNKSGKVDFTVTSGGASATTSAYYKSAAKSAGTVLAIDVPAAVKPGSTLIVKATLKDKFGNNVDAESGSANQSLAISYAGPGLQVNTPTAFVGGALQFGVLLGANDSGTATVTISVYTGTAKLTTAKTVVVGTVAGAQSTSVKRTGNTVAVRVTGYAKSRIVLNGVRVASRSTLGTLSRNLTLRAGRNVIQIVVDGQVIRTVRYTR